MFVVTKLDRLARSLPDAGDTLELTKRSVKLSLGGLIRDPTGPVGRLLFTVWVCQPTGEPSVDLFGEHQHGIVVETDHGPWGD